mmetsp:Transcript_1469/g.1698  ORF Transcript_1469/g.1698 Transcript_1469/m.1698 type:complete len:106 (-) Transcript_1469:115-432(-)
MGVLVYEMSYGAPPYGYYTGRLTDGSGRWTEGIKEYYWGATQSPGNVSFVADLRDIYRCDFLRQLLQADPALRLGRGGVNEVKAHPYFEGLDWTSLVDNDADQRS